MFSKKIAFQTKFTLYDVISSAFFLWKEDIEWVYVTFKEKQN